MAVDRMRIAHLGVRDFPQRHGGIERVVEHLGAALVARGHEVQVLSDSEDAPRSQTIPSGVIVKNAPALRTKHLHAVSSGVAHLARLSRKDVDVVHIHGVGPGVLTPLSRIRRIPVVLHVHGMDFERAKWSPAARRLFTAGAGVGLRRASTVICASDYLAQEVRSRWGIESHVVRNGVHLVEPEEPGSTLRSLGIERGKYLLMVARLVPEKRIEVALEAYSRLPLPRLPLIIVGSGGDSYTDDYAERLTANPPEGARFVGAVKADAELIGGAAAFLTSSELEGLPITLLEAQVAGVPIVATNIAPHLEVAGPGVRIVPVGDVEAFSHSIAEVLGDPHAAEVARTSAAGYRETYDWANIAGRVEAIYRGLLTR